MSIPGRLAVLALRPAAEGALQATGQSAGDAAVEPVSQFLVRHFAEHSTAFADSLRLAIDRSWKAIEVALNGVLWLRQVSNAEDKSVIDLLTPFVQRTEHKFGQRESQRRSALAELKDARNKNYLSIPVAISDTMPAALAGGVALYAKFDDDERLQKADRMAVRQIGDELKQAGYRNLASILSPGEGEPLLAIAARFFFRNSIEPGSLLAEVFAFAKSEELPPRLQAGLSGLCEVMTYHARRLEELLGNFPKTIVEPPVIPLILKMEQEARGSDHAELYQTIDDLRRRFDLTHESVQPHDQHTVQNLTNHRQILNVIDQYRALPESERRSRPALLNAIAQFELAIGDANAAVRDFHFVAVMLDDQAAKALAYMNAHRAALLQPDYLTALQELLDAIRVDGRRVATFPVGRYIPNRILSSDGFSTAYSCKQKHTHAPVEVKTLSAQYLERDVDDIFRDAQALNAIGHPAIIHIQDCAFVDSAKRQRPYMVMDLFDELTLEQYVTRNGTLSPDDLALLMEPVAAALQAAHAKNIVHGNIKPATLLVKRLANAGGAARWEVKLIDFGLAIKAPYLRTGRASKPGANPSAFASPEQLGRFPGVEVGPRSDVYSFGKTCCFALFQTASPSAENWTVVPPTLAELLERCLSEKPVDRPADFAAIHECLTRLAQKAAPTPPITSAFEVVD